MLGDGVRDPRFATRTNLIYCSTQRTWQVCQILAYLFAASPVKITALAHEDSTAFPHCSAPGCSNAYFIAGFGLPHISSASKRDLIGLTHHIWVRYLY